MARFGVIESDMTTPSPHVIEPITTRVRQRVGTLGEFLGRLVGHDPGFTDAEKHALAEVLRQRIEEAQAASPMTGDAVHKKFFLPVLQAHDRRFERLARARPHL